ncbi:sulfotransferase family protein [Streptomyces netropsis]|uniref:sulfotransferase family protein n=1 Tax=Streptomyces netropsis TaxID=55404 RepID=UPI0037BB0313
MIRNYRHSVRVSSEGNGESEIRRLVFVVGTGRNGSTALSEIMCLHPDVMSLSEFFSSIEMELVPEALLNGEEFWKLLASCDTLWNRLLRNGVAAPEILYPRGRGRRYDAHTTGIPAVCLTTLPHLAEDPDLLFDRLCSVVSGWPQRASSGQFRALFALLCRQFDRRVVVERSGYSLPWLPLLHRCFPDARVVHLYRSGPDCALSMSRHPTFRTVVLLRQIFSYAGVSRLSDMTPQHVWGLPADLAWFFEESFDPELLTERRIPLVDFGKLWSQTVVRGVRDLAAIAQEQRLVIAYEDLVDRPEEELRRLAEFAGVAARPDWLAGGCAVLDASRRGASDRLPKRELAALRTACSSGTRALQRSLAVTS